MEQEIHITLRFSLATGKVGLNEIVYKLKKFRDPLMLKILERILSGYDDLISERLSRTDIYSGKATGDERVVSFRPHNGSITVISSENGRLQLVRLGSQGETEPLVGVPTAPSPSGNGLK